MTSAVVTLRSVAGEGVVRNNVVAVRMLALCPMLAVSVSVVSAATLGMITLLVMAAAGFLVAALRPFVASAVRLPTFLLIVASLVGLADVLLAAHAYDIHQRLSIFLPLVITNCAVLARLELFAAHHPPLHAMVDGIFSGAGMLLALLALAAARELIGSGSIAGVPLWEGGIPSALLPTGGFILFSLLLVAFRWARGASR